MLRATPPRRRPAALAASLVLALAALATPARAHEFWLLPDTFEPQVGAPFGIRLFVGDGFERGRPYARNPLHIKEFNTISASGENAVGGRPGQDPAGDWAASEPGVAALVYRSHPSPLSLAADRFEAYLRKEGLEHISEQRAAAGETDEAAREAFSRCAKALVRVGDAGPEGFDRRTGLDLELVPLEAPFALAPGSKLPVLLLWKGEPVAGALIRAFVQGRPDLTTELRTGDDGSAVVTLTAPGVWLLSTVHMVAAPEGSEVDWESTWSSITFENRP